MRPNRSDHERTVGVAIVATRLRSERLGELRPEPGPCKPAVRRKIRPASPADLHLQACAQTSASPSALTVTESHPSMTTVGADQGDWTVASKESDSFSATVIWTACVPARTSSAIWFQSSRRPAGSEIAR
jgi:hypothetical protein